MEFISLDFESHSIDDICRIMLNIIFEILESHIEKKSKMPALIVRSQTIRNAGNHTCLVGHAW